MNVLFISRAYPPVLGGIEKHNFEISQSLAKISHTILVANKKGRYFLPFFIPFALFKAVLLRKHYDVILLGDGVLSIVAFFVKIFSSKPVVCVVHGLDITYQNFIYRLFWRKCFFRKVDRFIAVGNETIFQAEKAGLSRDKFCFIPNGVNVERELEAYSSAEFYSLLACTPPGPVLLTLGRLVKRKGIVWFIDEVMPALDPSVTYVIAGAGPEEDKIRQAVIRHKLEKRVILLGRVSEREKDILLGSADLFIQPNIPVEHDMEGFGLVVLEAARYGTFVLASALEGLNDAVTDGENGTLVPAGDRSAYLREIKLLLSEREELGKKAKAAQAYVLDNYSWKKIAYSYRSVLQDVISEQG